MLESKLATSYGVYNATTSTSECRHAEKKKYVSNMHCKAIVAYKLQPIIRYVTLGIYNSFEALTYECEYFFLRMTVHILYISCYLWIVHYKLVQEI